MLLINTVARYVFDSVSVRQLATKQFMQVLAAIQEEQFLRPRLAQVALILFRKNKAEKSFPHS